jgi:hypothetical protein
MQSSGLVRTTALPSRAEGNSALSCRNTKGPRYEGPRLCRCSESALREASDSVDDVTCARLEAVRAVLDAVPDFPCLPLDGASVPAQRGRASPLEAVELTAQGVAIAIAAE